MKYLYFRDINDIVEIHRKTVEASGGGTDGILNLDALDCAIEQIQNDYYYPEFEDKLTHLFWVANKNHCFQDGNKRIAISICGMFLLMNGLMRIAGTFFQRMESISLHVAAGNIEKDLLHEIITSILYEEDYSEELKIKLIEAFSKNMVDDDSIT